MKQKTIATRHLRTKIAAGYVLILFVIFGIVYIWLNEQHRRQELEITSQKIRCLRKDIHEVYVKMVDLSLIGETVLDWNEEDMNIYHKKRLEVDSLLSLFKSSYRSERIDSVCRLLAEKENLLNKIMLVLNEQEEIKDKIARRVPVIARKSSQEEPPKRKRTGFLGLFGKKEEAKPTVTTSMLNTLNSDVKLYAMTIKPPHASVAQKLFVAKSSMEKSYFNPNRSLYYLTNSTTLAVFLTTFSKVVYRMR